MRIKTPCLTCSGSTRKGMIWLGGTDWLECPNCIDGVMEVHESRFTPKERTVFIPGLRPYTERQLHIQQARIIG